MYKKVMLAVLLTAIACCPMFLGGCNGGNNDLSWPAADISGTWTGTFTESDSETSISFLFMQSGPKITGTATFMGRIEGSFHGRTLTIEGTDLVGYLADDFATIRGAFTTAAGTPALFTITKDEGTAAPVSAPSSSSGGDGQSSDDGGTGSDTWPPPGWSDYVPTPPPMP